MFETDTPQRAIEQTGERLSSPTERDDSTEADRAGQNLMRTCQGRHPSRRGYRANGKIISPMP
jgi:hypothetical protein